MSLWDHDYLSDHDFHGYIHRTVRSQGEDGGRRTDGERETRIRVRDRQTEGVPRGP